MKTLRRFVSRSLALVALLNIAGCLGTFFGTEMPEYLKEHGVTADAKILEVWDTGWTVNDDPVVGMRVEVTPADRPRFEATIKRYIVSRLDVGQVRPGTTVSVRYDPNDTTNIAVYAGDSGLSALTPSDRARIDGPDVVQLQTPASKADVPTEIRGMKALLVTSIVGDREPGKSEEETAEECRASALTQFDQVGWWVLHDASEAPDVVARGDCVASAKIIAMHSATYVLLPVPGKGMRIETPSGELIVELEPIARTFVCRDADTARCTELVKNFIAADLVRQIGASEALKRYARNKRVYP